MGRCSTTGVNDGEISVSRTDGDIPVVVETVPSAGSVALSVYVRAGSRNEPRDRAGMAHLLEHMVFRGTRSFDSRQISERIENAGGELNGFTGKEFTCYHTSILSETFDTASKVLAELISCPALAEKSFELERRIVTQEVSMLLDEPDSYIQYLFTRALWDGHPMSVPETGDFETIGSISLQDLRGFYHSNYSPRNLIVVASGNVGQGKVRDWASGFDDMPTAPKGPDQQPPSPRADVRIFHREGDQAYVGMGFPGVPAVDPSRHTQRILAALLGAGMSSRLFQRVREESGLVYSIFTTSMHYTDCGNMSTFFSCSTSNLQRVVDAVAREFSRIKVDGLEPGELDRSKKLIKGATVRRLESMENRMFRLGEAYSKTGTVKPMEEMFKEMESVTEDEVMAIAERIMRPETLCVAMHGPGSALDRVSQELDF